MNLEKIQTHSTVLVNLAVWHFDDQSWNFSCCLEEFCYQLSQKVPRVRWGFTDYRLEGSRDDGFHLGCWVSGSRPDQDVPP